MISAKPPLTIAQQVQKLTDRGMQGSTMQHRPKPTRFAKLFAEQYPRLMAGVEECFVEGERLAALVRANLQRVMASDRT